jgi:hypothetical protein
VPELRSARVSRVLVRRRAPAAAPVRQGRNARSALRTRMATRERKRPSSRTLVPLCRLSTLGRRRARHPDERSPLYDPSGAFMKALVKNRRTLRRPTRCVSSASCARRGSTMSTPCYRCACGGRSTTCAQLPTCGRTCDVRQIVEYAHVTYRGRVAESHAQSRTTSHTTQ